MLRVVVICVQGLFTFCCLVLLLVRYLGFITEGNTYRRYATSSLPLQGNTDVVPATIKGVADPLGAQGLLPEMLDLLRCCMESTKVLLIDG